MPFELDMVVFNDVVPFAFGLMVVICCVPFELGLAIVTVIIFKIQLATHSAYSFK